MRPFERMKRGMGIGGWMSNIKRVAFLPRETAFDFTAGDLEYIKTFITKRDIQNIRSMGMDHIRIPFDQVVIEDAAVSGAYREEVLCCLDRAIDWCMAEGLDVVINLHRALGNYANYKNEPNILSDGFLQARFIRLWKMLEDRYHDLDIVFKLLNEVYRDDPEAWNALAEQCVKAIRAKNPLRRIMIGPVKWNRLDRLGDLRLYDDDHIGYTFHFYEPHTFTHQRTTTSVLQYAYNREIPYPGDSSYYRDFALFCGEDPSGYDAWPAVGRDYIENALHKAAVFKKAHPDRFLWLGEFGTIRHAPLKCREAWMRDVIRFAVRYDIPYSVWNYLSTPYDCNKCSLVTDDERRIVSREMLRIIQGIVD